MYAHISGGGRGKAALALQPHAERGHMAMMACWCNDDTCTYNVGGLQCGASPEMEVRATGLGMGVACTTYRRGEKYGYYRAHEEALGAEGKEGMENGQAV